MERTRGLFAGLSIVLPLLSGCSVLFNNYPVQFPDQLNALVGTHFIRFPDAA